MFMVEMNQLSGEVFKKATPRKVLKQLRQLSNSRRAVRTSASTAGCFSRRSTVIA